MIDVAASGGPQLIDTDVHQALPDLRPYLPSHWRDRWLTVGLGAGTGYVNPRGVLRRDTISPRGGGPASDPAFVLEDHLDRWPGTLVVVSHDRHMLELIADRLVLVDGGTAREFDGSIEDYTALVLAKDPGSAKGQGKASRKEDRRTAAAAREKGQALRSRAKAAEAEVEKLTTLRSAIDRAMFDPAGASKELARLTMTELLQRRAAVERELEAAEAQWLEASEALEQRAA